jgi:hypothetical protein
LAATSPGAFAPNLAMSLHNLGVILDKSGRHDEARTAGREALSLYVRLYRDQPVAFEEDLELTRRAHADRLAEGGFEPSADETHLAATAALARHRLGGP